MQKKERNHLLNASFWPLVLVLAAWGVWLFMGEQSVEWGILPQHLIGLRGLLFSPFIHDPEDVSHLVNNSVPLLFLGWALRFFYRELFWKVLLLVWLLSGFWVWLVVQGEAYHIGASGLVYGLASFLFFSGLIRRQRNLLGLTMLVSFLYGGMVWGVFPYDLGISWQSHLFGGLAGVLLAVLYRKKGWQREKYEWDSEVVSESFSELNQRHEGVISGKIPDPNEESPPPPPFTIHYEWVEKKDPS